MTGKGSTPRPLSVDAETFAANYARVFQPVRCICCGGTEHTHHSEPDCVADIFSRCACGHEFYTYQQAKASGIARGVAPRKGRRARAV